MTVHPTDFSTQAPARAVPAHRVIPAPPLWRAEELTQGGQTAHIVLGNQIYTLRITRQGKLILTK